MPESVFVAGSLPLRGCDSTGSRPDRGSCRRLRSRGQGDPRRRLRGRPPRRDRQQRAQFCRRGHRPVPCPDTTGRPPTGPWADALSGDGRTTPVPGRFVRRRVLVLCVEVRRGPDPHARRFRCWIGPMRHGLASGSRQRIRSLLRQGWRSATAGFTWDRRASGRPRLRAHARLAASSQARRATSALWVVVFIVSAALALLLLGTTEYSPGGASFQL